LLDVGSGVVGELLRRCSLAELDAAWVTHVHPDHASDLGLLRNAIAYGSGRDGRPLNVFGPPGWRAWFDAAVPDTDATNRSFHPVDVSDRGSYGAGDIEMEAFAMRHSVPTFGCRLSGDGAVIAFSGDSAPCPLMLELAAHADLFLCEAYLSGPLAETSDIVMTPEQAGEAAHAAAVKRLVLTHLHPDADPKGALQRAASTFSGPIEVARPGAKFQIETAV
jgi:ribonuclease BN (tRNA processing enzyme)